MRKYKIAAILMIIHGGFMDGILAGSALILMLMQYYGDKKIINE